jgi:asparaginyl-tRNA synthetase
MNGITELEAEVARGILENFRDRHDYVKHNSLACVAKIEASLLEGARKYFKENDFTEMVTPHVTKATGSCENVSTMFEVNDLGTQAYLCQTGQLYLEAMIPKLGNVYCVGPSFRKEMNPAEKKEDKRHLIEFTLVEMEFPGNYEQLLDRIEGLIRAVVNVIDNNKDDLEYMGVSSKRLEQIRKPFARLDYEKQAIPLVKDYFPDAYFGMDLNHTMEMTISSCLPDTPVFIMHYPKEIKFFNMRENDHDTRIVNSADLILPYSGEAVGAAERENRYDYLKKRLEDSTMLKQLVEKGGSIKDFEWYLECVKHNGELLHSGCGVGLNRVTQYVLGARDIRVSTPFPMQNQFML